eukprot:TRINITY_DN5953_c1_g2_i2.p1 TRINITY_DN5953_c1_g2~~TRINITY_DN5953_c1_g2_i2.p1  ORF type:complete len:164 (-),score=23.93 TRINITY_DN5953_c1_g2_i2:361-852(-)
MTDDSQAVSFISALLIPFLAQKLKEKYAKIRRSTPHLTRALLLLLGEATTVTAILRSKKWKDGNLLVAMVGRILKAHLMGVDSRDAGDDASTMKARNAPMSTEAGVLSKAESASPSMISLAVKATDAIKTSLGGSGDGDHMFSHEGRRSYTATRTLCSLLQEA